MKCLLRCCLLLLPSLAVYAQPLDSAAVAFVRQGLLTPEQYVIQAFQTHDVVLLGERHVVKENLLFVQSLIPALYKNGIYVLGMEFGASEVQPQMDQLVTAATYSEATARELMFTYNVAWGFQEYLDVCKAAWAFNRTLPAGARPFRILNLSYIYHWEKYTGARTPESMQQVFPKGTADKFRMEVIEREVLQRGDKLLALVGTPHAYTRYGSPYFKYNGDHFCDFDREWLGNRLYARYPGKVFNILLHQAFTQKTGDTWSLVSPAGGAVERLMALNGNKPAGFNLLHTPMGKLPDSSTNAMCYDNFTLEQFFDGYLFLEPLRDLEGCTVVEEFVNETNIGQALKNFPDPDWHPNVSNLQDVRKMIRRTSEEVAEQLRGL